ncbi:MAG: hypothetical protein JNK05_29475 [Myxococcales bacterium]|nr:hypothetical protein [Myxococcales bacterium]
MPSSDRRSLLERARAFGAARRLAQCEAICTALLADDPRDASVLRLLAWAQYERGGAADAERSARRWLAIEPESHEALRAYGRALARQGRANEAVVPLRKCSQMSGWDEDVARLARVLASVDEHRGEALTLVRARATRAWCDGEARGVHQWLRSAVTLDDPPSIRAFCERLAGLAPDDGPLRASCASAMVRIGELSIAHAHAVDAIAASPNNVLAWSVRAVICRAQGRHDELDECERALRTARSAAHSSSNRAGENSTISGSIASIT